MIPENICVQADGILKLMKTLVLIQHHVERILQKKSKIVIPNCPPLVVGENYTEIKAWQLKFVYETKKSFERTEALKQTI